MVKLAASGKSVAHRAQAPRHLALLVGVFALLVAPQAFAYLDPGTGSILLQGSIAAAAAALTWISVQWRRLRQWWLALSGGSAPAADPE